MSEVAQYSDGHLANLAREAGNVTTRMASKPQTGPIAFFNAELGPGVKWEYTSVTTPERYGDTLCRTGGKNGNEAREWLISHGPQGELLLLISADTRDAVHQSNALRIICPTCIDNICVSTLRSYRTLARRGSGVISTRT